MAFVITPSGGGGVTFADVVANFDTSANTYWDEVDPEGPEYSIQEIGAPAVDGVAVGRAGFRNRRITARVIIVAATPSACYTALASIEACFDQPCAVQIPNGSTYAACELKGWEITEQPTDTGYSTFLMRVTIVIEQKRLA